MMSYLLVGYGSRANRLVDALAKQGAESVRVNAETRNLVASAQAASLHAACLLGQVTFAANNYKALQLDEKGNMVTVTLRDSDPKPRSYKRQCAGEGEAFAKVPRAAKLTGKKRAHSPLELERTPRVKRPCDKARLVTARAAAEVEKVALERNLEQRGSQLRESSAVPAAQRLELLKKRVRLRLGSEPPVRQADEQPALHCA